MKGINIFPRDCTNECKYYRTYDLSIDDLVGVCRLLKRECDLCDQDYSFLICPLENKKPDFTNHTGDDFER